MSFLNQGKDLVGIVAASSITGGVALASYGVTALYTTLHAMEGTENPATNFAVGLVQLMGYSAGTLSLAASISCGIYGFISVKRKYMNMETDQ
ncbi:MAG: hypothetical protein Q7R96_04780 [Nanoarchaeota archaeon]|nr:hypothetical protein [Nanoarchaeota archaeon]